MNSSDFFLKFPYSKVKISYQAMTGQKGSPALVADGKARLQRLLPPDSKHTTRGQGEAAEPEGIRGCQGLGAGERNAWLGPGGCSGQGNHSAGDIHAVKHSSKPTERTAQSASPVVSTDAG